jgi:NAD(P)-dependent dehydrogenase (short-subunit alcohol dehydrogenase family)
VSALHGKVAVVTGAGSGIGRATSIRLAREGAVVHAADLDGDTAAATAAEIGAGATAHEVDVTDEGSVQALADAAFAAGRVDILHNNAGIGHAGPSDRIATDLWRRVVEVNLMGVVHGIQAFGPRMLTHAGGGHIVNTASAAGLMAVPEMVPYATTKHAVVGLSESLNAEWKPRGVLVTALCPGIINTPITRNAVLDEELEAERDRVVAFYERFGASADDVADAVVDLLRRRTAPIRTVPRAHVLPGWVARRLSPRGAQPLARLSQRLLRRGSAR